MIKYLECKGGCAIISKKLFGFIILFFCFFVGLIFVNKETFADTYTPPFTDVSSDHWAVDYISAIKDAGITVGYPDGTFRPEESVTRAQMAAFIIRAIEGEPQQGSYDTDPYFADVDPTHWAFKYVQRVRERNIAHGYPGNLYGPEDDVTREQMAKMLIMGLVSEGEITEPPEDYCSSGSSFPDVEQDRWSCRYIKRLKELGITTGYPDGTYRPEASVTRAEMAAFIYRAFIDKGTKSMVFLQSMMDKYHKTFDVYTDVNSGGNHFLVKAKMWGYGSSEMIEMDECSSGEIQLHQGSATYIKVTFKPQYGNSWGGFYFMNGIFPSDAREPQQNWGDHPDAGFNLTGATKLTFFARGEKGGEKVEFFVGGIGWPDRPYKESLPKVSTGYITLSKEWKQYSIDLTSKDLTYVLSGFGWVTDASRNLGQEITFYIDDIRFDKDRPDDLRFIVSYETHPTQQNNFDVVMRNVAFIYDNALALLAFLARGTPDDLRRAKILADSFVFSSQNDRFYNDGRLRNAYSSGDLKSFPGWESNNKKVTARLPGFWDCKKKEWFEDKFSVSTYSGNIAWVMIALISAYEKLGEREYLSTAEKLGEWVEQNLKDFRGAGGYLAGFDGWEPDPEKLFYKSTEHNLDLYVAFIRLYELTKEAKWKERALHAKKFIEAMWDEIEGKFWTGTKEDGVTINKDIVPLDIQAWAILVFKDETQKYIRALKYAEEHHAVGEGFDFDTDKDGIWYEGTAQMAVAYKLIGEEVKAQNLLKAIEEAQLSSGAIPAASKDGLTTGFDWLYFHRGHIGATAWYLFAKLGVNPYWIK